MKVHAPKDFNGAKLLGVFESGTSEWHEARADGIGGSEIGTLLGLNPWDSAYSLWAKRSDLIPTEEITSMAAKIGTKLETPILELFAEAHPELDVYTTGTYQHPLIPYLHANPDALAYDKARDKWIIIEVKTSRNYWYEVPPAYIAQVQHYMDVMSLDESIIVALVGMDYQEHSVPRDDFEIESARTQAGIFWNCLQNGTQPRWDGSEATYEAVRKEHPDIIDEEVEVDGAHNLLLAQAKFEEAQAEFLTAKAAVLKAMGKSKHAFVEFEGEKFRVASRQAKGQGLPFLVVNKKGKK